MVEKLAKEGVSVFRLNLSYGTHEEHSKFMSEIEAVAKKTPVAVLCDLQVLPSLSLKGC